MANTKSAIKRIRRISKQTAVNKQNASRNVSRITKKIAAI
jgi:ribosomal protein S20